MAGKQVVITDGLLTMEDRKAGYLLVEIGPKLRGLNRNPEATGIFHEFDEQHPNNQEALVVDGRVCKVYRTPRVAMAIAKGVLVESNKPETPTVQVADIVDAELESRGAVNDSKDAEIARLRRQLADMQESARTNQPA